MIEVKSDEFDGMADTTFDVSSIAEEGDQIVILHYDETKQEWEFVSQETVDANGKINADFSSYSPVAFVKVNSDGSYDKISLEAGLYDADGNLLCAWEDTGIDVETNYIATTYNTKTYSPNYVITKTYPTTTKIVLPDTITSIGSKAFYKLENITEVIIPNTVTSIGENAFGYCKALDNVVIPDSVQVISGYAFEDCIKLKNITIGSGVSTIGQKAFQYCDELETIVIPDNVTSVANGLFTNCKKLTNVTLSKNQGQISAQMFWECTGLRNLVVPEGITELGVQAFNGCDDLLTITLPKSLKTISTYAIGYPDDLTIYYRGSAKDWELITISASYGTMPTKYNLICDYTE